MILSETLGYSLKEFVAFDRDIERSITSPIPHL